MRKRSITISIILVILFGVIGFNYYKVQADSGWDTSYDSGSDSSSSWDSGSSHNSGSSNTKRWDSKESEEFRKRELIIFIGWPTLCVVIIIILKFVFGLFGIDITALNKTSKPVDVNIPGFDKDKFLEESYKMFVDVQKAWMNIDYETLQKLLSDELFNTYKAQLKALEAKKQRNEMSNFELVSNDITAFEESNSNYTIKTKLKVKFYDYVVDENKNILRGTDKNRIIVSYELTFVGSKDEKPNKCPNCGAPLNNEASTQCPNCNSTIVNEYHDFVLTKKQMIFQDKE